MSEGRIDDDNGMRANCAGQIPVCLCSCLCLANFGFVWKNRQEVPVYLERQLEKVVLDAQDNYERFHHGVMSRYLRGLRLE